MNKQEYSELLKDERWKTFRLKIIKRDKYQCTNCRTKNCLLHVHHKIYIEGRMPWQYNPEHVVTLCTHCHKQVHETTKIPVVTFESIRKVQDVNTVVQKINNKPKSKKDKKKVGFHVHRGEAIKKSIENIKTREKFIQRIHGNFYRLQKVKDKIKKEKDTYKLNRFRRAYVEKYGKNYNGINPEVVEKLFLTWDE